MAHMFVVPEGESIIAVDGIFVSREVFQYFADQANIGTQFTFVRREPNGVVTIESVKG